METVTKSTGKSVYLQFSKSKRILFIIIFSVMGPIPHIVCFMQFVNYLQLHLIPTTISIPIITLPRKYYFKSSLLGNENDFSTFLMIMESVNFFHFAFNLQSEDIEELFQDSSNQEVYCLLLLKEKNSTINAHCSS